LSLPRHKAILTAILNRDPLGARQASLVQLENARADADSIFETHLAGHVTDVP
jgi:DNA-binding FadR family transcriptional regulator